MKYGAFSLTRSIENHRLLKSTLLMFCYGFGTVHCSLNDLVMIKRHDVNFRFLLSVPSCPSGGHFHVLRQCHIASCPHHRDNALPTVLGLHGGWHSRHHIQLRRRVRRLPETLRKTRV